MKKFLAAILSSAMILALMACGSSSSSSSSQGSGSSQGAAAETGAIETKAAEAGTSGGDIIEVEPQTWKFATSSTDTHSWAQMGRDFGDMISERTGGAITVEIYTSDQLTAGNQTEGIQGAIDGTIELSAHSNLIYSSFDQRLNVVSLPFLFDDFDDVDEKLDGAAGAAVGEIVESLGLHLMGIGENGFRHPTNNVRAIENVSDMKGLKMRVAGSTLLNEEYEAWGANWTNANFSEVYTGLQTGTYDGQENPLPSTDAAAINEVQKFVTYWTGVYDCVFFTMNIDLYNSLSPELQAAVDECGMEAVKAQRISERAQDEEILEKWSNQGIEVTYLDEEGVQSFKDASDYIYTDERFIEMLTEDLIGLFTE